MTIVREYWLPVAAVLAGMVIAFGQADADSEQAELKRTWQERYALVLDKAASAELRIEAARKVKRKLRQRDRYKGPQRVEVDSELAAAEQELETARKEIAAFPDTARQAGIPPGWLREVEERHARDG